MAAKLSKLMKLAKARGINSETMTRKILQFFIKNSLVTFLPSGFSGYSPDIVRVVSDKMGMSYETAVRIVEKLVKAGILKQTKGMSSIGGREYWFGLAEGI